MMHQPSSVSAAAYGESLTAVPVGGGADSAVAVIAVPADPAPQIAPQVFTAEVVGSVSSVGPEPHPPAAAVHVADLPPAAVPTAPSRIDVAAELLFCARRALYAAAGSAMVHLCIMVVLGRLAASDFGFGKMVMGERRLEATVLQIDEVATDPPTISTLSLPTRLMATSPVSAALGLGTAGRGGGSGGGTQGGVNVVGIAAGPPSGPSGGNRGRGMDRAFGDDLMTDIGAVPTGATFFGVRAEGNSFVFVVDTSGSMSRNSRFLRCRRELLRSVTALHYRQKYFICFFNHDLFAMPEGALVDAKADQIRKTTKWIQLALPTGFTNPWPGLQQAINMKPDAIYLLTDGEFDPAVMQLVISAQPESKKIPIHTIAFESKEGEPVLKTISRVTGGEYRFVP